MQDAKANNALFKFIKQWKPGIRVLVGDLWDFRPIRGGASDDEKHQSMEKDFEAGGQWLDNFQPHYFIRGNHDERLWFLAESGDGVRADYAGKCILEIESTVKKMRCRMLPYHKRDGILRLGHLKILHGFASGVYASRQTALVYGSALFGHIHCIDEHAIAGLDRRVARACGCLCKLDMDYNSRMPMTLRQAHGFAYGVIHQKTGKYFVWQAEEVNGEWMLPSDVVSIKL